MWSPWQQLAEEFPGWTVRACDNMPDGHPELVDFRHRIVWMDHDLDPAEQRSALAHSLEHIRAGHDGPCCNAVEAHVDELAARNLITTTQLLDVLVWTSKLTEAAECLHVDEPTLVTRLQRLHHWERAAIRRRLARREEAA